jgi:curved DNA-binding protein CbpA
VSCPYALFGFERRPWLSESTLREAYLAAAKSAHPDAARDGGKAFAGLREAYETLREPSRRLRHLARELPPGTDAPRNFPSAELFMEVAPIITEARKGTTTASTPIGRAAAAASLAGVRTQLQNVIKKLRAHRSALDARLEDIDRRWPEATREELLALANEYTFCSRWLDSAEELAFELAMRG